MSDAMMQMRCKSEKFTHNFSYQFGAVTVPLVVMVPVDLEVHRGSITFNKIGEDRRALQDVDVVV